MTPEIPCGLHRIALIVGVCLSGAVTLTIGGLIALAVG